MNYFSELLNGERCKISAGNGGQAWFDSVVIIVNELRCTEEPCAVCPGTNLLYLEVKAGLGNGSLLYLSFPYSQLNSLNDPERQGNDVILHLEEYVTNYTGNLNHRFTQPELASAAYIKLRFKTLGDADKFFKVVVDRYRGSLSSPPGRKFKRLLRDSFRSVTTLVENKQRLIEFKKAVMETLFNLKEILDPTKAIHPAARRLALQAAPEAQQVQSLFDMIFIDSGGLQAVESQSSLPTPSGLVDSTSSRESFAQLTEAKKKMVSHNSLMMVHSNVSQQKITLLVQGKAPLQSQLAHEVLTDFSQVLCSGMLQDEHIIDLASGFVIFNRSRAFDLITPTDYMGLVDSLYRAGRADEVKAQSDDYLCLPTPGLESYDACVISLCGRKYICKTQFWRDLRLQRIIFTLREGKNGVSSRKHIDCLQLAAKAKTSIAVCKAFMETLQDANVLCYDETEGCYYLNCILPAIPELWLEKVKSSLWSGGATQNL